MLGPLFRYDLLCTARRSRFIAVRCWYALALLAALFCLYGSWFGVGSFGTALSRADEAAFATDFFLTFLAVQLAAVLLLTPAYTSGAVAEEREAGRLDFLLTTELSDREIVLGKFAARLGSVGLILLTGLPILGLMQFLGGVDPNLVLAGFAATLATMFSVGSFGVWVSTFCEKASSALWLTYLGVGLALGSCWCCPGLNLGHPAVAYDYLDQTLRGNEDLGGVLPLLMIGYAAVHGLVAFGTLTFAVNSLRPLVARPVAVLLPVPRLLPPLPSRPEPLPPPRPRVGDNALLWKELHLGAGPISPDLQELVVACCVVAITGVITICVGLFFEVFTRSQEEREVALILVRATGVPLAGLMLLRIGLSAAASVSRERDQRTLDSLLMLPVDCREILSAKWLGSVLCVRHLMGVLLLVWIAALLVGGMHPLSVPILAGVFLAFAGCAAALGLYCSVTSPNRRHATLLFLGMLLLWQGTPWLFPQPYSSLSPLAALWQLTFPPPGVHPARNEWMPESCGFAGVGALFSVAVGGVMWALTEFHFEKEKGPAPNGMVLPPPAPAGYDTTQ